MALAPVTPIDVAGARGGYFVQGAGRTLVLLISPFSTAAVYRPTIEALARSFRVIAVEFPGSARGSGLREPWGFPEHARWTLALLDAIDLPELVLVGHSHSAAVAVHLAATAPARVRGLVLVNAVGAHGPRVVLETLAACAVCLPMEVPFIARSVPRIASNLLRHGRNFFRQLLVASNADVGDVARRVTAPTLLAWGAHDYVEPPSSLRRLHRMIPAADVYWSTRGSHDWLIERPAEFARAVRAWDAGRTPDPTPDRVESGFLADPTRPAT